MAKQYKKLILIIIIILCLTVISTFIACIVLTPKLYLTNKNVDVEVNTKYVEPGYKSYVLNKDITNKVKIKSNLNINKIMK